ncbi:MAG: ATP phosphoribosyltransferase regulatory subunit, partial [Merismopedia sp. SIO2A8]|nr:ATP phosphoribosyltransferase regulatory subunit [Merismopedia sp. SIO2A8]
QQEAANRVDLQALPEVQTFALPTPLPTPVRYKVRQAIANLDRVALETLPLSPQLRERALFLFNLRGCPLEVLQQITSLDLEPSEYEIVNNLKSLIELINHSCDNACNLILDLSLVQTFDYYSGIVFEVVSDTDSNQRVICSGGRYDQLLGLYHPQGETYPGIGFCFYIEELHNVLLSSSQLPSQLAASDWLVIAQTPQAEAAAFSYAQKLRDSEHLVRVEMDLGGRDADQIREYARRRRVTYLAWIKADGTPTIETMR